MRLILLNGPWGVGKSTTAAGLHATLPRALHIELDAIRRAMSGYEDSREESFRFAVRLAKRIIEECIADERDVILDKMLFSGTIIDEIVWDARAKGAEVHEILLWAELPVVLARGEKRGYSAEFSEEKARHAWHLLASLFAKRTTAKVIDTTHLSPSQVLEKVLAEIS